MFNKNDNSPLIRQIRKRITLLIILSSAILFSLTALILSPIYIYTCSDIVYAVTAIPEIIKVAIDLVDVFAYALCFSALIYSISRFGFSGSVKPIMIFSSACFLRYTANLLITLISYGSLNVGDALSVLLPFVFDVSIALIISAFAYNAIKKTLYANGKLPAVSSENQLFTKKNPLHVSALFSGSLLAAVKIVTRLVYDIFYGLPTSIADAIWMSAYYITDLLVVVIVYAVSIYTITKLEARENT